VVEHKHVHGGYTFEHGCPVILDTLQDGRLLEGGVQYERHAVLYCATHHHIAVYVGARQRRDHRIPFTALVHQGRHGHIEQYVAVGQAGALGVASGAGCVTNGRQGIGVDIAYLKRIVAGGDNLIERQHPLRYFTLTKGNQLPHLRFLFHAGNRKRLLMGGDNNTGATIIGHEFHFARCQHHIDGVYHRPGFKGTVVADYPLPAVPGIQGHPVAGLYTESDQRVSAAVGECFEFVKGQLSIGNDQRGPITIAPCCFCRDLSDGIHHDSSYASDRL